MIASVAFRNFKALRETSLALAPFNLVIGPNGSGKTSLIEAILRLRTLAKLPLASAHGAARKTGGPEIEFHFVPPHAAITARLSCVSELVCDFLEIDPPHAPGWAALQSELLTLRGYELDHAVIGAGAGRDDAAELKPNGSNLSAVLARIRADAPDAFAALTAEMLRIAPEFRSIELTETAERVDLSLRLAEGDSVPAPELSQGMLYLLAILTLAFDPTPPRIICLEEADRGIHPRMLREIRDTLYRLSYPKSFGLTRPPVQVIATTHSPYLLDLFRDHPEEVVISQKRGRAAHFERLADRADLPELMQEGTLGDMWFSGILGGVPEEKS